MLYNYCPKCGQPLALRLVEDIERLVCVACGFIFYQHSKVCSSALVVAEEKLLLVRRAIEPFKGWWDIPGGFLEAGEHPEAGAIREVREETSLQVQLAGLVGVYMDTYGPEAEPTLNFCYVAAIIGGEAQAQSDALELRWFALDALPEQIAFSWSMEAIRQLTENIGYETGVS